MDKMQDMYDVNFQFYKRMNDDEEFARNFFDWMFDWYMRQREAA